MSDAETKKPEDESRNVVNSAMRDLHARQVKSGFADLVTLMMNSQRYRHCFLSELEWLLVPAVATGQFLVSHGRDKASGLSVPTAAVLWASVSAEVDKRLAASGGAPRLKPSEWRSGNIPWLMDVIGDQASGASLVKRLAEGGVGKGGLRCMDRLPDGRAIVRVLGAAAGAREPAAV